MKSSSNSGSSSKSGVGFWGLLQLAFIILKLCNVINWSWWLVLMPLWIELIVAVGMIFFIKWLME